MLILFLNLRKYVLKINKKINLIINESSCLLGKKLRERERESIDLSTYMNLYNIYILQIQFIQIYMRKLQLEKKKNKNVRCKRDFIERL